MKNNKQIFYDHDADIKKLNEEVTANNTQNKALLGFLEFGSEFHTPFAYPLTADAVEELKYDIKKDKEEQKK